MIARLVHIEAGRVVRPTSTVITTDDVQDAERKARRADQQAAAAWEAVEEATRDAEQFESQAAELHERAARLRLQVGFRRPPVAP